MVPVGGSSQGRASGAGAEVAEGDERGDIVGGENGAEGGRELAERDN